MGGFESTENCEHHNIYVLVLKTAYLFRVILNSEMLDSACGGYNILPFIKGELSCKTREFFSIY